MARYFFGILNTDGKTELFKANSLRKLRKERSVIVKAENIAKVSQIVKLDKNSNLPAIFSINIKQKKVDS